MALPPPWTPAGNGSKGVGAQSNGGGSSEPRGGKRAASERRAGRSVALWTKQSGAQVPPRRGSRPPLSPDSPRLPVPPGWHTTTKQTHLNPPHPEPLSKHMIRAVWCRRIKSDTPLINHATTRPASSARPALALRGGAHNNTSISEQAQTVKGGGVGGSSTQNSTFTICPRPPVCAPPLSGAPETVTPSDTSMPVRGREWHQHVGVCGKQQREGNVGVWVRRCADDVYYTTLTS